MTLADLPLVLTVEEAGKALRIGRGAAYEAARRGDLPVVRIGRSLRVPRSALEDLLNGDGTGPQTDPVQSIPDEKVAHAEATTPPG